MQLNPKLKIEKRVIFTDIQPKNKKSSNQKPILPVSKSPVRGGKKTTNKEKQSIPNKPTRLKTTSGEHRLPLNIFLLGDPAAGKATQAEFLVKKYSLYDLDMGKELRKLQQRDPKIRNAMAKTYDKGHVTQTNIVRKIFEQKIFSTPKNKGILFDGNPKQIGEAKLIFQWLKQQGRTRAILIYLNIPMSETVKRMSSRVEYFNGKFSKRTDDNKEALQNRVKYYRKNIAGVVKFFKTKYPYKQINALGTRNQVKTRILEFISKYEK